MLDNAANERDFQLLSGDRYTFSVLSRVLQGPCNCVLTDHERLIFCHTVRPYPVWIWTPDNISDDEKERAWQLASRTLSLKEGYRYNLKYELAEYFIARAGGNGLQVHISTNLFAYDCPAACPPEKSADGYLHLCTPEDMDEATDMIYQFHADIADGQPSREDCRARAEEHIGNNGFFFWKNASGETVACCSRRVDGTLGCIGSVYTRPEHRRKHYAQHLVYGVTKSVIDQGQTPMLYTDADYVASNACYEKIGYVLRGKLCTIAAK